MANHLRDHGYGGRVMRGREKECLDVAAVAYRRVRPVGGVVRVGFFCTERLGNLKLRGCFRVERIAGSHEHCQRRFLDLFRGGLNDDLNGWFSWAVPMKPQSNNIPAVINDLRMCGTPPVLMGFYLTSFRASIVRAESNPA